MKKTLIIFLLLSNIIFAQVCFNNAVNYSAQSPYSQTSDDFNSDGFLDLVICSQSSFISLRLGNGAGTFGPAINFSTSNSAAQAVSADFNGDSKPDVAVCGGAGNLWIFLATGTASFAPAVNYATGIFPGAICKADLNNDGKVDLVVANGNVSNSICVFLGTGTGTFGNPVFYSVGNCPCGFALTSDDFNNDGKADIAVANQNSNNVSILLGTGNGGLNTPTNYTVGNGPWCVVSADFNNDNIKDLATANRYSNNVSILLGLAIGGYSPAVNYMVGTSPLSIFSADFNNDGKKDLVTSNGASSDVSILLATTPGFFSSAIQFQAGLFPINVISADFNQDAKMDLAVSNLNSSNVSILLNSAPSLSVNLISNTVCSGQSLMLSAIGANTYTWSNGLNTSSIVVSPTTNISFTASASFTGACVFTALAIINISVFPLPVVLITATNSICAGGSAPLSASGALTYSWNTGANTSSILVSPINNTSYSVSGTSSLGCISLTPAVTSITVNALPVVSITATNSICAGGSAALSSSGALTYSWNTGANTSSILVSPINNTSYSVSGTSSLGCISLTPAVTSITVNALPIIAINGASVICKGEITNLNLSGALSYTWSTGANVANIVVSPTSNTTYSASATGTNGCIGTNSLQVAVNECLGFTSNPAKSSQIRLFPNPNNGLFYVTIEDLADAQITISNTLGQTILIKKAERVNMIQLTEFNNGMYYMTVSKNNTVLFSTSVFKQQ